MLCLVCRDPELEKCSAFCVVISSHGAANGVVYGTDKGTTIDVILQSVKNCKYLAGKPKLVIVQVEL